MLLRDVLVRAGHNGRPELAVPERHPEPGRHHADDAPRSAVQRERASKRGGGRPEAGGGKHLADEHHVVALLILLRGESAARYGNAPEQREEVRRDEDAVNTTPLVTLD